AYNTEHGITPATIKRAIFDMKPASGTTDYYAVPKSGARERPDGSVKEPSEFEVLEKIEAVRQEMFAAAENLQFETAARLRDELKRLQGLAGDAIPASTRGPSSTRGPTSARGPASARPKARCATVSKSTRFFRAFSRSPWSSASATSRNDCAALSAICSQRLTRGARSSD